MRPAGAHCAYCLCTEENACEGGCSWAEDGICTTCVPVNEFLQTTLMPWLLDKLDERQATSVLALLGGMYVSLMRDAGIPDAGIWEDLAELDELNRKNAGLPARRVALVGPDGRPVG